MRRRFPGETELRGQAPDSRRAVLATLDAALSELVDMHFFGGLSFVEIAELRGVSERTVQRDWKKARSLLHRLVRGGTSALGD